MSYFTSSAPIPQNSLLPPPAWKGANADARRQANFDLSRTGRERLYANIPVGADFARYSLNLAVDAQTMLNASEAARQTVLNGVGDSTNAGFLAGLEADLASLLANAPVVLSLNGSNAIAPSQANTSDDASSSAAHHSGGVLQSSRSGSGQGEAGETPAKTNRASRLRTLRLLSGLGRCLRVSGRSRHFWRNGIDALVVGGARRGGFVCDEPEGAALMAYRWGMGDTASTSAAAPVVAPPLGIVSPIPSSCPWGQMITGSTCGYGAYSLGTAVFTLPAQLLNKIAPTVLAGDSMGVGALGVSAIGWGAAWFFLLRGKGRR